MKPPRRIKKMPMEPATIMANEHPVYMSKGGPIKKQGGIKGYLSGGSVINNNAITDPNYRTYKAGTGATLGDIGLGVADTTLGLLGADNVIKSDDYNTKGGVGYNKANSQYISPIAKAGTEIALSTIFSPAAGAAYMAGTSAIGGITGEDKRLSNKERNTANTMNTLGTTAVGLYGTLPPKTPVSTGESLGIDTTPHDMTQEELDIQEADILKASKGMSEGGQIKGKGTAKSDSIPADVEEGGFIVPAENAHIALMLRRKYFGDTVNKKAKI